jgi:hypothetical protein
MKDIEEALYDSFCNRTLNFLGLVQFTKSRINEELVDVLRPVTQSMNFEPIVYQDVPLAFLIVNDDIQINSFRSGTFPITLVVVSDEYLDHKTVISALGGYEFNEMTLNLNSQQIYATYFVEDENKPFQGFAFTLRLVIQENFSV